MRRGLISSSSGARLNSASPDARSLSATARALLSIEATARGTSSAVHLSRENSPRTLEALIETRLVGVAEEVDGILSTNEVLSATEARRSHRQHISRADVGSSIARLGNIARVDSGSADN